ncbi:hypothetical protein [Nocardioides sp. SR21]|uniref:hypothetical protein n=1 Tax=Nocardioides sp. SR21 TaxID=2919501 RepID=UPI001FAA7E4D|nr:hypothetical protein [Nocardioides sp. SR21]
MACEEVGEFLVCSKPQDDSGTIWWDVGGGTIWSVPLGSVAELLTVLAAVAAIVTAWKASVKSHKLQESLNDLEQQRESRTQQELARRAEADERAEQADHIAAWLGKSKFADYVRVIVSNGGGLPIYNVEMTLVRPSDWVGVLRERRGMLTPEGRSAVDVRLNDLGSAELLVPRAEWDDDWRVKYRVAIEFDDSAGRRWIRDPNGRLHPLSRSDSFLAGDEVITMVRDWDSPLKDV